MIDSGTTGVLTFRGGEYSVISKVENHGRALVVEVEDRLSSDLWKSSFDVAYIEDMTHKTGNFKQFSIFVNMLESAVMQRSDVVSLDLLTYNDLEALRSRKGSGNNSRQAAAGRSSVVLGSKRYLILTYTVEFDRIHYPLPLNYVGKSDPKALQATIKQLQQEIRQLQSQGSKDYRLKEVDKLRKELDQALQEKEELEAEYLSFRRELQLTKEGSAVKEIRSLKSVIKHLEEDLMKERNKYQKSSSKRNQEYRDLLAEVEELRASERNLKIRVKSLTNELAMTKRQGRATYSSSSTRVRESSSRENSFNSKYSSASRHSRDRSLEGRSNSFGRDRNSSRNRSLERSARSFDGTSRLSRDRSGSRERPFLRNGRASRENSLTKARSSSTERGRSLERPRSTGYRTRSPSPSFSVSSAGARTPRFDPTAYIKEKERKTKESHLKKRRHERSTMNGSGEGRFVRSSPAGSGRIPGRSRASSTGSLRSRTSSVESLSDGVTSDISSNRRLNSALKTKKYYSRNSRVSPDVSFSRKANLSGGSGQKKILSSTPEKLKNKEKSSYKEKENKLPLESDDNDYYDRSKEISDIDARLNRLQQFMDTNLALS